MLFSNFYFQVVSFLGLTCFVFPPWCLIRRKVPHIAQVDMRIVTVEITEQPEGLSWPLLLLLLLLLLL